MSERFTIYDAMEKKGVFRANPANVSAIDPITGESKYVRAEYPKMFYHPKGEEEVLIAGAVDPQTGRVEGLTKGIKFAVAKDPDGEAKLRAAGWHDHPSDAMRAAGRDAPPKSPAQHINSLEDENARLRKELEALYGPSPVPVTQPSTGASTSAGSSPPHLDDD